MKCLLSGLMKLITVFVFIGLLVACGGADERKVKYLEKGKTYLADKNYDKARVEIKNVLQIDPKFAEAYYLMGLLEEEKKELAKSLSNYKKAIELDPKYTLAKIKLARIYVIAGTDDFIKKANKLLDEVKQGNPDNSEAQLILATIEYKTGSKGKATSDLENVIKADISLTEGISLLSSIYLANDEEKKAIDLLIKGVESNSESISLRISLARILAKNKNYTGAEKYLKQAISIEPEKYSLQVALSSFYATTNQLDKAETILRKAIEQDDEDTQRYLVLVEMLASRVSIQKGEDELKLAIKNKPDLYELKFAQIKFYKKTGKREEAKNILKQIISDKSYDVEGVNARNLLAKYLLEEGDKQGARTYVNDVISEYPNDSDALLITSKLALADLDAIVAINGMRTVVKNDPKNTEASLLLAQAYELNKESLLAENELKKAIEANPINDQTHANYARYLTSKGRVIEAVTVIDKALAYFKDSYDLMDIKLKIVASQGKETEVLELMDMMEQTNTNKPQINIIKGQYYLSKGEIHKAIEEFEKAYTKSRDKYKPLKLIVQAYLINKQPDNAFDRLQQRLDKDPEDAMANLLSGQIYQLLKKYKDAQAKFIMASKSAETWFLPYSSLASLYLAEQKPDQALSVYQDAVGKLKNKVPAWMQIASLYERQKNFSAAIETYQQIIANNPGNKLAANNYASLLLDYGKESDFSKAVELVKNFEKLQQPAFLDTLGWAYAKTGENIKAVEVLKPIVEKAPKIAIFRYHLGYALYHMGDKAAAKTHLEISLSSEQEFTGKDKAEALLKTI
ncbi:MAG: tetratricopeptide repeat protein [Pseudomonadota bacterium]